MYLVDAAAVIRSKNAGPYELTLDVIFKTTRWFDHAIETNLLNKELICQLYRVSEDDVLRIVNFRPANAIKVTIVRPIASGAIGETDVYGAQQHAPLLKIVFADGAPK
ncbi:DUF4387 domain-containing protein [Hoeflea alexandrii]|uniref:DUF4387 domain-containing protein n=1 Tax=Hoeflea alexandrii TaxID=288436 RepID=UPI0022AF2A24|nr:DUF4387 domain-containing protein [Hoeflea alexandrii]MCZ4291519.1 DUF4387 domain-containing protein [Hoeflea alexandrii]